LFRKLGLRQTGILSQFAKTSAERRVTLSHGDHPHFSAQNLRKLLRFYSLVNNI
jgi:hypothetical protein